MDKLPVQELLERAQQLARSLYNDAKEGSDNQLLLLQLTFLIVGAKNGVMLSKDASLRKPPVVNQRETGGMHFLRVSARLLTLGNLEHTKHFTPEVQGGRVIGRAHARGFFAIAAE